MYIIEILQDDLCFRASDIYHFIYLTICLRMDGQTKSDFERDEINKIPRLIGEQTKTSLLFISYELCCIQTRKKKREIYLCLSYWSFCISPTTSLTFFHLPSVRWEKRGERWHQRTFQTDELNSPLLHPHFVYIHLTSQKVTATILDHVKSRVSKATRKGDCGFQIKIPPTIPALPGYSLTYAYKHS